MNEDSRVLEFLGLLGLVGLVAFLLTVLIALMEGSGANLLLLGGSLVAMLIGASAWVGILVANRVAIRQDLILEQLAELQRGQAD